MATTNTATNLIFKKGLHQNLPQAKTAGTIYVTTDEKCMYVDISSTERIRLQGSVLYYETLQEFYKNEKPPYSTDVIYFIEKTEKLEEDGSKSYEALNALMRWDAVAEKWIQLNATADSVTAAIEQLSENIRTLAASVATNYETKTDAASKLGEAKSYADTQANAAKESAITAANAYTDAEVAKEKKRAEDAEKALSENIGAVSTNLTTNYETKEDAQGKLNTAKSYAETQANTAKENAITTANAYTDAEVLDEKNRAEGAERQLSDNIGTLATTVSTTYETKDDAAGKLAEAKTYAETQASTAQTSAIAAANTYTDTEVLEEKNRAEDAERQLSENIGAVNTNLTTNYETKEDAQGKLNTAKSYAETQASTAQTNAVATANAYTDAEVAKEKKRAEDAEKALSENIGAVSTNLTTNYETKSDAADKLNAAKSYADTQANTAKANAITTANAYTDAEVLKEKNRAILAEQQLSQDIGAVSGNLANNYYTKADTYTKTEIDTKDANTLQAAKDYVSSVLRAAEAMRYMGSVEGDSEEALEAELLQKTDAEAGDVWVVTGVTAGKYHPGDMLIAAKDNPTTIEDWNLVNTGYDANLEQKLVSTAGLNGGSIALNSIGSFDGGDFVIKADDSEITVDGVKKLVYNSNIRVKMTVDGTTPGNTGTITIGMVWDTFE